MTRIPGRSAPRASTTMRRVPSTRKRRGRWRAVSAREEGIFAGVSSGLNVAAAIQLATELGPGRSVVTVAVDTGLKYLAGDLFN